MLKPIINTSIIPVALKFEHPFIFLRKVSIASGREWIYQGQAGLIFSGQALRQPQTQGSGILAGNPVAKEFVAEDFISVLLTYINKKTFMKKTIILAAGIFFSLNSLIAQSNSEDIDIVQAAWGKNKKDLVSQYMQIPAKDSVAFWKLYDEYETARKALGKERIGLIQQYADNYDKLTDTKAAEIGNATLANDAKYAQLYQTYFKKFNGVIGGRNSAKLFQLETYLQTLVKAKVQTEIPFIDELDKAQIESPKQ